MDMTQENRIDPKDYDVLSDAELLFFCPYDEYIDAIDEGPLDKSALKSLLMIAYSFAFLCEEIYKNNPDEIEKFTQLKHSEEPFIEVLFRLSVEAVQNLVALYGLRGEVRFIPALCDAETSVKDKLLCIRAFLTEASKAVELQRHNQSFRKIAGVSVSKAFSAGMTVTDTAQ